MDGATNAWYVRHGWDEAARRWWVSGYHGPQHPDGVVLGPDGPPVDTGDALRLWTADADGAGRLCLDVDPDAAPRAPGTWFVAIPRLREDPPTMSLVAFATDHLPVGTVVDNATFMSLAVRSQDQVAAVQWSPDTAVVAQVFVQPDWRRRQLATRMVYAASACHQAHGWPGALHSDGRRTDMGEEFTAGLRHPERIAPLSEKAAPMDRT